MAEATRIVASEAAVHAVHMGGGRLWVWTRSSRCCGAGVRLEAATEVRADRVFRTVADEPFEVRLATAYVAPQELHVECRGAGRSRSTGTAVPG